jgi:hypothetical protein
MENVGWNYGGISPMVNLGCSCLGSSFDLDGFDRAFVPAVHTYSVNVLDANGNLVLRIGGYGNADSRGNDSAVIDPKSGLLRPRQAGDPASLSSPLPGLGLLFPRYAAATDEAVYVVDPENERIVRVKLGYASEEIVPLP